MPLSIQQVWQVEASHFKHPATLKSGHIQQATIGEESIFFAKLLKSDVYLDLLATKMADGLVRYRDDVPNRLAALREQRR